MGKISELFDKVGSAVEDVNAKRLVVEETKAKYDAASQDLASAEASLSSLRDELNTSLGDVLQPSKSRAVVRA